MKAALKQSFIVLGHSLPLIWLRTVGFDVRALAEVSGKIKPSG